MNLENASLTKKTLQGTFWAYSTTYGSKLMVFITTAILARLLTQEDFGVAGYAIVIMGYLEILNGFGVGPALIYYPEDEEKSNAAFWLSIALGIILFVLAWVIAPLAGDFFRDSRAIPVTRILAFSFPLTAIGMVHESLLRKKLAFNLKAIPDFIRVLSKGFVSISMALLGYGVWSLIFGQLAGIIFSVIAYWIVLSWRPALKLSFTSVRSLYSYGLSIVSVRVFSFILLNTDFLLVGRFLGATALGVYSLAYRVPNLLIGQFADILGQVLFPLYVKLGNEGDLQRKGLVVTMRYVSMVTAPLGIGLALVARPFVIVIFTDKWVEAVPLVTLLSIAVVLDSLIYNIGDVYKAQGRPDILTKISGARVVITIPALLWAVTYPGTMVAVGRVILIMAITGVSIQLIVARQILGLLFVDVFQSLKPAIIGTFTMSVVVFLVLNLLGHTSPLARLIFGVLAGGVAYIGVLWLTQRKVLVNAMHTLKTGMAQRQ